MRAKLFSYLERKHSSFVAVLLCLFQTVFYIQADSQTAVVKGKVSTSTTPVRYASVTFEDTNDTTRKFSALTDSSGGYRLDIILTSVGPSTNLPTKFELEQNYPNPFSSSTAIPYELKAQSDIQVTIYDILGRVVRKITAGTQSVGIHSVLWDGRNKFGQKVATGIYFYRLQAGGESQVRKMVFNAGGYAHISLPQEYSSAMPKISQRVDQYVLGGNFTVRVENTINTSPSIVPREIDDVVIQRDTTIDFIVDAVTVTTVFLDSVQQYIRGFGAANILSWRPDMTSDEVSKAFGTGPGQVGFTMLRLRVPYTDNVGEFAANVPTAKLAESMGAIVFASPWTPPPAMKSNNNIVGGMLNESSYAAYAAHLKGFADYMAENGAPLYAISLQNEPDANVSYESCSWNATQFLNFTKNNAAAIGIRVIMPESENFQHALSDPTLNDSAAAANVAIIAGHIYGGGLGPYPLATSKGKEIWMTEHLDTDTSWAAVLATGTEIHNCMVAGMNAYVWWYIVRFYGPIGEDGNVTKRGYIMSQYARFVRPGFYRIKCNSQPQRNVYLTSYKDSSSSKVVIVALNTNSSPIEQAFSITGGRMTIFIPYTTSVSKNCEQGDAVSVTNGSCTVTLDPSSVTTFVSN
jgi:glucuronoarabinoxylan endo-1,4-beta-xylanase